MSRLRSCAKRQGFPDAEGLYLYELSEHREYDPASTQIPLTVSQKEISEIERLKAVPSSSRCTCSCDPWFQYVPGIDVVSGLRLSARLRNQGRRSDTTAHREVLSQIGHHQIGFFLENEKIKFGSLNTPFSSPALHLSILR